MPQAGLMLVRSLWLAQVTVHAWEPRFEIGHRRIVSPGEVRSLLPTVYLPVYRRAMAEAGLV